MARLERHLLRTLARTTELALFDELKVFRAADNGGYDAFVLSNLADGLVPLFCAYPVLARQVAIIIGRWASATAELASRIVIDREALAATFATAARLADIEPALWTPTTAPLRRRADLRAGRARGLQACSLALDAATARFRLGGRVPPAADGGPEAPRATPTLAGLALRVLDRGATGIELSSRGLRQHRRRTAISRPPAARVPDHVPRPAILHGERHRDPPRPGADRPEMLLQPVGRLPPEPGAPSGEPVARTVALPSRRPSPTARAA
jgi:hypothetical protein